LGIASILPILLKFSIDSCIANLQYFFYSSYILQYKWQFWIFTNNYSESFYCED